MPSNPITEKELAKELTKALAEALKPAIRDAVLDAFVSQEAIAQGVKKHLGDKGETAESFM